MNSRSFLLLFILAAFINGCSPKNDLKSIVTSGCYWDIFEKGSVHPINSCFKFGKDGSCGFYYYEFVNKRKTDAVYKYGEFDLVIPEKWGIKNDSLIIQSNKYFVIRYDSDTIYLSATGNDTLVLIKNCKTHNSKDKN